MNKPDFKYRIFRGEHRLYLIDLNLGNKSLTNGIDQVTEEIGKEENVDLSNYEIYYRDSENQWDGYDYETGRFYHCPANYDYLFK